PPAGPGGGPRPARGGRPRAPPAAVWAPRAALLAGPAAARPQQLCAAYRTDALRRAIAKGGPPQGASMHSVVERLSTSTLSVVGPGAVRAETTDVDPTWDIDTPEDLHRLEYLLDAKPTDP
ncbi:MAG: hypothetical protein LH630_10815, partial [Actinomycetia bacterium]|nr:hypothetical protein [Actinomycetes bacterium]